MTAAIFIQVAENGFFIRFEFCSSEPKTAKGVRKKITLDCDISAPYANNIERPVIFKDHQRMTPDKPDIFSTLIDTHKGIIYRIANLYCTHVEERKDLVQEILFQVWKSFDRYNDQYKHSTWIYRIALNVAISFYRKEKSRRKISSPYPEAIFNMAEELPPTPATGDIVLLQQFISELKELDKAVMLLYLEAKSHKEIAEIIGITETNVATKIGRIKKQLKQKFLQKTI